MNAGAANSLDDCFLHDKDRLTHDEALALIAAQFKPMVGCETVALADAASRYVAADIRSGRDIPGQDNAAVDGYAVRFADLAKDIPTTMVVSARIAAGAALNGSLVQGTAARIFTGAKVPNGADTVVMQEDVARSPDGFVIIPAGVMPGANVRPHGEDVVAREVIVSANQSLRPQDIAALASVGCAEVTAFRPLRIAILSTGDELRRPGEDISTGEVYDTNSFLLRALLGGSPVEITDLGILADDAKAVHAVLKDAAERYDIILTSGGASRGEEDHLVKAVEALGRLYGWQIAIKPGRPMGFGTIGHSAIMALPGNPVAVMVCFLLYALPMIAALGGGTPVPPRRFALPAAFEISGKKPDRREFLRATTIERDGCLWAEKYSRDGSGLISSLRYASGLIEIPEETTRVEKGSMVAFIPFGEFGLFSS